MSVKEEHDSFVRRVVTASLRAGKLTSQRKATVLANRLWNMRIRSSRLAEAACNRGLSEREDRIDTQMDETVKNIGEQLGLVAYRQGDPRGWTIRVEVPRDLADNWDGKTTGCG